MPQYITDDGELFRFAQRYPQNEKLVSEVVDFAAPSVAVDSWKCEKTNKLMFLTSEYILMTMSLGIMRFYRSC